MRRSLRNRCLDPKFLYLGEAQTQAWLALHERCSPYRQDKKVGAIYEQAGAATARRISGSRVHVVGLGCGGGKKDTGVIRHLLGAGKEVCYSACDISDEMTRVAVATAAQALAPSHCYQWVGDLAAPQTIARACAPVPGFSDAARVVTLFGMLPNLEPGQVMPDLAATLTDRDLLLVSANLAPGPDYQRGVDQVLPLYDNEPTRAWLLAFLPQVELGAADGSLEFNVEEHPDFGLKRIGASFRFSRDCRALVGGEAIPFRRDERLRLFFSYRHTPELVQNLIARVGLIVGGQWIAANKEEGVFLIGKGGVGAPNT